MADLTFGEIGVTLQEQLMAQDLTQNPPVLTPLDLTNAQQVQLLYAMVDPANPIFQSPIVAQMGILSPPANGVVFYTFKAGDLAKPSGVSKYGIFKYTIRVTFLNGNVFYTNIDGQFTIKDDSVL